VTATRKRSRRENRGQASGVALRPKRTGTAWIIAAAFLLLPLAAATVQGAPLPAGQRAELAGNNISIYPYFEYVRAFNVDAAVRVGIDPFRFPGIVGETADIYVVEAKDAAQWSSDPGLTDVAGGPLSVTFSGASIQENRWVVATANTLEADAGAGLGVGYDVVIDMNRNGLLDTPDYIDGLDSEAGFYMVHDTTQPGPYAVTEITYSGGSWLGQDTYYPSNIASLGLLPLVVISHGNGHNYQWYDHIGNHLASYGYIVMSHENNTGPGIETASTTTLTNTDYILGNLGSIGGGVLDGHLDTHAITWIGHSRGAEGITRAYDRIFDGAYTPANFTRQDIVLLSSMLPTDFLRTPGSNPHDANYHLWTAAGDADVNGSAGTDLAQTFHLHDRATGYRQSTVVQGTGHAWFHDGGGTSWFTGPCSIGETNTHLIQQGYFLPLLEHYVRGNIPAHDFLWRQYERFHPIGVDTTDPCIVVTHEYRNGAASGNFFIDDFQSSPSTLVSSSGGAITFTAENLTEGRLDDNNSSFSWTSGDPFNGATQCSSQGSDDSAGVVFDWTAADLYIEWEVIPAQRNLSDYRYLSFRAAQGTQHPNTLAVMGDLTFSVTLRDGSGTTSSINIGAYGGGLEQPYDRSGGWHNEMEVIRIRLTDFLNNNSGLDLSNVTAVRLDCGPSWGSSEGRIVVDELMLSGGSSPLPRLVTGPGPAEANPTIVRTWDPASPSSFLDEWPAYGVASYGVNVAVGDLDGNSVGEIVTGAGPGAVFGPHVRGFTGSGTPVPGVSFLAYGTNKFGVNVTCGDFDGDGIDEIVTGAGPGAVFGPHVRGWNVDGGTATAVGAISYFAYGTPKWGVNVACGDIDGDGFDEIVTGAGPGTVYGPHVRGWNYDNSAVAPIGGVSFLAYGTNQFGVNVGCGDIDGDGIDEIITAAGPGVVFGPHVRGWNVDGGTAAPMGGVSFFAYDGSLYGASVAAVDVDGDGYDEILTMPGPDPAQAAVARAWNVDGGTAALITGIDFDAYVGLGVTRGGRIAGGNF
jgi:hypothetical protein